MLIADNFVFIHLPKTGGTFVTRVLKSLLVPSRFRQKVHSARRDWRFRIPGYQYRYVELPKHGMRKHIPAEFSDRIVLTCVRNPLDLYVSHYKFGWWKQNKTRWYANADAVEAEFGSVDDMSFSDFVRTTHTHSSWRVGKLEGREDSTVPGRMSLEWVHYFCEEPESVLAPFPDAEAVATQIKAQLTGLRVLRMEHLNHDLADFLQDCGCTDQEVSRVREHPKVFPGRRTRSDDDDHRNYYDDTLFEDVSRWESILLRVFYGTELAYVPK